MTSIHHLRRPLIAPGTQVPEPVLELICHYSDPLVKAWSLALRKSRVLLKIFPSDWTVSSIRLWSGVFCILTFDYAG